MYLSVASRAPRRIKKRRLSKRISLHSKGIVMSHEWMNKQEVRAILAHGGLIRAPHLRRSMNKHE